MVTWEDSQYNPGDKPKESPSLMETFLQGLWNQQRELVNQVQLKKEREVIRMNHLDLNELEDHYDLRIYDAKQAHRIETLAQELTHLVQLDRDQYREAQRRNTDETITK